MQKLWLSFILFHFGSFKYFKHYYKEYVCNHLIHLFFHCVYYNRFESWKRKYASFEQFYSLIPQHYYKIFFLST